jgi:hypothetical protein
MTNEPLVPTCECGTIISSSGGRCPTCGTPWPEASPVSRSGSRSRTSQASSDAPVRASVPGERGPATSFPATASPGRPASSKTPLITGLAVGLVAAGAAVFWLSQDDAVEDVVEPSALSVAPPPSVAAGTPDPGILGLADLAEIAPLDVLPKARTRARVWDANAVLVSIRAQGVTRGLLDGTRGGSIHLEFGVPKKRGALGSGEPVGRRRFVVSVDKNGSRVTERSTSGRAVSVGDPDCPLPSAWHKMAKSGVPKSEIVSFTYSARRGDDRTVWLAKVPRKPKLTRTLDGRECTILAN